MYIKLVKLKNFKIFKYHEIEFNKGFNIMIGKHATGKSTIIDAIRFIVDPQFENSSENMNLYSFKYKPDDSTTGYVELSFYSRDKDSNVCVVRRDFSNLDVIKINGRQIMKLRGFYNFLRNRNFLTNSFMSPFIDLEVLYKADNNNGIFKNLSFHISKHVKLHTDIRNLVLSIENILKAKLEKLTEYAKYYISTLCEQETALINRLQSVTFFNDYIYNLRKHRNINGFLSCELDKLKYLEEFHYGVSDSHAIVINNIVNLEENLNIKSESSSFFDVTDCVTIITRLLDNLHGTINNISALDINDIVCYPMQLDAQQQNNRYVMNLKRTLKTKNIIAKSIQGDIKLLNSIIIRKRSKEANLIKSIKSNLSDFVKTKNRLDEISSTLGDPENESTFHPYSYNCFIDYFLNERSLYYKMKLILCFNYNPSCLNGLQNVNQIIRGPRILPVFRCIRFKNDFIIKDNTYEYLKPILDWIIIFETDSEPFEIPPNMCHITFVPIKHLHYNVKTPVALNSEFQYIWDGLDFDALREMDVLTDDETVYLKFIFYQQQLTKKYDSGLLSGGNQSRPNDIIELCDTLQNFFRISVLRDELANYKNIFANQTYIPSKLFSYKENLDSIILITKNLKHNFKVLLTIAEELQYLKEDVKLKTKCLTQFSDRAEFYTVIEDFDLPRYKTSADNIDQIKTKIEELEIRCSSLNYKFNVLFTNVYLPLDGFVEIVLNVKLHFEQKLEWNTVLSNLQLEFSYSKELSENNLSAIAEVERTTHNLKKIYLTDDEEFSSLINGNVSTINANLLDKSSFYETLQNLINFVPFQKDAQDKINHAIKTIRKVKDLKFTSDVYAFVKIQVHDQVNDSIEIANQLLDNFNRKIKIVCNDWIDNLDENINEDNKMNLLKSFQFIIQKKVCPYPEQSTMTCFNDKLPTRGDFYLVKLMFILGVALNNRHKLLTFDDISVILNKNKNILVSILQLEEIYQEQQIIMACNPTEIVTDDLKELNEYFTRISEIETFNVINLG